MTRHAHLVGAWPGRDPEHAMETALTQMAPYLKRMTDGETGDRHMWITPVIDAWRANPDVEIVRDGDWSDAEKTAQFRVREGASLNPDNIRLGYALAFQRSFPAFTVLRERFDRADLRFQVGIPSPIDLALYTFGEAAYADPSLLEACTTATVDEIERIHAAGGEEVVFQLETVACLVAVAQATSDEQPSVAQRMAGTLLDLVSRAPAGAHFGVHLCLGDFHHKAFATMHDVRPLVLVANALADGWPDKSTLDYVHAPFAAAAEPPVTEASFYEALRDLELPDDVRFIAGFQHEKLDHQGHKQLLARIERLAGREVDVAAACGLGRRPTPEEAFEAMRETKALLEETAPTTA